MAREELSSLVDIIRARQLPLLLLANKHDLPDAASVEVVSATMAQVRASRSRLSPTATLHLRRLPHPAHGLGVQVLTKLRRDGCATAVAACCAHDTASVQTALEWVCARRGHRSGVRLGQGSGNQV